MSIRSMTGIRVTGFTAFATAVLLAASALSASPMLAQAAKPLDDPTIVAIFDAANSWDIETGNLASKQGAAKSVKDFGAMLARDHNTVRTQGRELAARLNVTPTPPANFAMAKDHAAAMSKLRALHGGAFDRAFLAHEVAYHQAVLDAVNTTLMPALKNADVRALVSKVAPAFEAHRAAAQKLLDELGSTGTK